MSSRWPGRMRRSASSGANHPARSTSGNDVLRPLRGGHSSSNRLLRSSLGSNSPSRAKAVTTLRPGCTISPSDTTSPSTRLPVSSSSSRRAAASGSSPSTYSPFGIDQAPRSFFAQNGPPGWTRRTSRCGWRRYIRMPALRLHSDFGPDAMQRERATGVPDTVRASRCSAVRDLTKMCATCSAARSAASRRSGCLRDDARASTSTGTAASAA